MNHKKKQKATAAMATLLSVSTMINPMTVMAQEDGITQQDVTQKDEGQPIEKKPIGLPDLPKNLKAKAGTRLKEVKLPDYFTWVDGDTILSIDTKEYAARYAVNDTMYDYTSIKGYHADGHYIEFELSIDVEAEDELTISALIIKSLFTSNTSIPSTYDATGDIPIDEAHFPDATFRAYLKAEFDKNDDNILSTTEIAKITSINVSDNQVITATAVTKLTGIENFPNLKNLNCSNTSISSLDVSNNANLEILQCTNTSISSLDVSKNTKLTNLNCSNNEKLLTLVVKGTSALESLNCYRSGISSLDVSESTKLTTLNCIYTGISSLDVSKNTNLTELYCYGNEKLQNLTLNVTGDSALKLLNCFQTSISSLDVSKNTKLTTLNCYSNEKLQTLTLNDTSALQLLNCSSTGISSLDVSKNTKLTSLICNRNKYLQALNVNGASALQLLNCYSTDISSLDVSKNTEFTTLDCNNTGISSLDVSKNTKLTSLKCYGNNSMQSLNVTGASALQSLSCYDSSISSLDVSTNTNLTNLDCHVNPLAYLKIGNNAGLTSVILPSPTIELEVTEDTFNITEEFSDIDKNKVSVKEGAEYDSSTGIVRNYTAGTPIVYEYDCGIANGANKTLTVTLNLTRVKKETRIVITSTPAQLNKSYDNSPVSTPNVTTTGSSSTVTYVWEKKKNETEWKNIATTPVDAGTYRVTAKVAEDENYKAAESDPVVFTISQADNSWKKALTINDWIYGKTASTPSAEPKFGTVASYTYSDSKTGTFKSGVPTNAGTWYVKASVTGTDNYKGLEEVKQFVIKKATPTLTLPSNLKGKQDASLSTVTLPKGWTWVKGDTSLAVNNSGYKARLTVDDANYDYTGVDGYNATGHYVEKTLTISVAQGENTWTLAPSIENWIYGETASTPKGTATHGTVTFTYSDSKTGTFKSDVPTSAGTWYMKASVAESVEYAELSNIVEFKISQADNSWTSALTINDWMYGKKTSTPSATAKYGTVTYTYSDSKTGTFKSDVPTNAGTWYVKASVTETDNYKGLEEIKQFEIKKATAPTVTLPSGLDGKQDALLSNVALPKGWTWVKGDTSLTVNNSGYKARLTVDDANYDYTGVDGYNAAGHYVEKTLTVSVAQGENTWSLAPSIENWIYGETASTPKGTATHGTVNFTYSDSKTGTFKSDVPTSAGTWYMKASVAESDEYAELTKIVEFTISQADNSWTSALTIDDWTYGKKASTPSATAKYGTVTYTYSDSKTGTFKSDVPTSAGTWYMKVFVESTENYKGMEEIIAFSIKQKNVDTNSEMIISNITSDTDLRQLVIKDGNNILLQGVDYDVYKEQNANQGKVTIQFKGNYSGTIVKTYSIKEDSSSTNTPTGDTSTIGLWTMLMTFAGGILALLNKKKQKEE